MIGALALGGIVPLAGFWSKDEILAEASTLNPVVYWLLLIAAFFTAFYMGRQVFMVFFGEARSEPAVHAEESKAIITIPLMILALLSITGGFLNFPSLHTLTTWLDHTVRAVVGGEGEAVSFNFVVAIISTVLAVGGIVLAWYLYIRRERDMQKLPLNDRPDDPLRSFIGPVFTLLENKYWVDELYGYVIVKPYQWLSTFLAEKVDWDFWHDFVHDKIVVRQL